MNKAISETVRKEIDEILTEYLLGAPSEFWPLAFEDPKIQYYVLDRQSPTSADSARYTAEEELFRRFWPPAEGPQVIHIVGGAGAGKSTFTRYFLQYYLLHRHKLRRAAGKPSPEENAIQAEAYGQHILLYVDLAHVEQPLRRTELFCKLSESLKRTALLGLAEDLQGGDELTEEWLSRNLCRLARDVRGDERRWYISWIFDNSDLLEEESQSELARIIHDYIPEEPPAIYGCDPVREGQGRELWRILIPIRPETRTNLARFWNSFRNKMSVNLDPVNPEILIEKRSQWLAHVVGASTKHARIDLYDITEARAGFDMMTPAEMAQHLCEDLLAASNLESSHGLTSRKAQEIVNQLVNGSARRRLALLPRIAFSPSFSERRAHAVEKNWAPPLVTPFYYFNGLICGNDVMFTPDDDRCLVLNLYDLGLTPGSAYSILVGPYAIYLLRQGRPWADVVSDLNRIGFPQNALLECERQLVNKELLKELWHGGHQVEIPVVDGHWQLLKERAYTDNMAVACAQSWDAQEEARPTDPLDPRQILPRFDGSLWFMNRLWEAEKLLPIFSQDTSRQFENFLSFSHFRKALRLPCVTHYVVSQYLEREQRLPSYEAPQKAIDNMRERWETNVRRLRALISESEAEDALEPRKR
ncbi:hypothetical protein LCGC14_0019060 [marine sediment metagenome]|uniref:Uncharacterized protein n=1 Tax=marine sediment metagenome TaxID=412755 RepID=A0A0F9W517_9ZZZZ|nr:ATP-binding protein [Phycisphaerae bacterium]HDZ43297.1 ATP-binding protein [Phycisphaerae bacterium]